MGSFFLVLVLRSRTGATQLIGALKRAGWEGWGWFLAAFAGIFTLLFTTFLTHPGGLWDGIYTGLKYWLDQHGVARGGEPWQFYSVVLTTIEWPALLLGAIGAVSLWRRKHAASPPSWSGTSSSRWPSTRGRARSSPGSSCTRCCR